MSRSALVAVRRVLLPLMILALLGSLALAAGPGLGQPVSGVWTASPTDICIAQDRVCADWIDDFLGYMGSCCIRPSALGQNAPNECSETQGWYALRLAGPQ